MSARHLEDAHEALLSRGEEGFDEVIMAIASYLESIRSFDCNPEYAERIADALDEDWGEAHPRAHALANLGRGHVALIDNRPSEAEDLLRAALDVLETSDTSRVHALRVYGDALATQRKFAEAVESRTEMVASASELMGAESRELGYALIHRAYARVQTGEHSGAAEDAERGCVLLEKLDEPFWPQLANARADLGQALEGLERWAEARVVYEKLVADHDESWGDDEGREGAVIRVALARVLIAEAEESLARELIEHVRMVGEFQPGAFAAVLEAADEIAARLSIDS